ncbi:MAG: DUF445 family protein, partial [bacterium]
ISELPNKKVGQAIGKKTFLKYVNLYKNKQLKKVSLNPEKVSRTIGHSMFKFIKDDRFSFLLNKQTSYQKQPTLSDNFHHITMSLIQNRIKKIRNKPLKEYYNNLQKKSSAPEKINKIVQEILEQNLAEILQGNIKNAVKDNLSGFSDQKVQAMVKEFMGEELKPITTLGAFLGGGAGLGLYFLNGLNPVTSILTYGFVGFITNVIALKMVFQPYEKKSLWGLNIPFTPGVVTRNKEQFAISLGDFIENRLLAPEAVQNTFQDNRKQLEKNITNIISKNNYQIFNQFIKNNSGFLAQKSSSSLLNYGLLNKNSLITTLNKNILNNKITYDMLEGYEKEVSQTILSNLEKNTHTLSRKINDIMKRDISIDELISDNFMEKKLEDIISNYINHLDNPKKIKKSLKIVADSTKNLRKQTFINLIPEEKVTDFNSFVINYIKNNNLANNFFDYVFSYLEDELNSDKKFKNIYQGKAFNLIRKNKSNIVNWLYEKILLYLEQERGKIKIEAQNALEVFIEKEKKQKSFLGKIKIMGLETTLKAININETINQLIDNLIDNKIPEYLENKKSDLENLIIIFLKNTEQKNVGNLGIQFNKKNIHEINNKLFDNQNTIEEISEDIFTAILQLNTNDLLNFLGLNDINSFYQFFQKEIMNISEHLRKNETKISQNLSSLLTSLIQNNTGNITLKKLFANINQKDLKDSLDNLFNTLSKNNTLQQELEDIIDSVFQQISGKNLSEYISYKYLNQDLNNFANIFLYQEKPKNQLQNLMEKQLEEIFINLPPKIDQETKDFILDILLYSSLDSLDKHFIEIISAIDIKNITRTEIDNMAPQDIEELFDSFAAPYFTRLKLYGWLGSGIGGLVELFNYLTL